jgi:hypothetical protein
MMTRAGSYLNRAAFILDYEKAYFALLSRILSDNLLCQFAGSLGNLQSLTCDCVYQPGEQRRNCYTGLQARQSCHSDRWNA